MDCLLESLSQDKYLFIGILSVDYNDCMVSLV